MQANVKNIERLVQKNFNGNRAQFAKALGVERSQVSMLLNHGNAVGAKFYGALIYYCEANNLNFKDYIVLPESVKRLDTA